MSYATSSLTMLANFGGGGPNNMKLWLLDTVDTTATVDTAGFISNAKTLGMQKGDIVIVRIWTTAIPATLAEKQTADDVANDLVSVGFHFVIGISTAGAADLTNTLAITATNTD